MSLNELLREFLLETHENLALLDSDLVTLEKKPRDKQTLAQVFRTLHSVKGTAGFIGLPKLQAVAHAAESLLSKLRDGEITFNQAIATALLKVVDAIREMLAHIESSEEEGPGDYSAVIAEVDLLRESGPAAEPDPQAPADTAEFNATPRLGDYSLRAEEKDRSQTPLVSPSAGTVPLNAAAGGVPPSAGTVEIPTSEPQPLEVSPSAGTVQMKGPAVPAAVPETKAPAAGPVIPASGANAPLVETATPVSAIPATAEPVTVNQAATAQTSTAPPESSDKSPTALADANIRVDVGLLDKMMTLVGELVLSRNQIMQFGTLQEDTGFQGAVQRLNLLTTELQTSVMKTRMQPIGTVWSKFPRIVRDLAVACGKKVRLETDGHETELDKTLIEAIRDPLTHMVRNAVDHAIEPPEVRKQLGKPAEGRLKIIAFHEGGKVIIEVSDDGSGIRASRVRDRAIANKLITPQDAARLSRAELLRLVFVPGFSTADKMTQFSGRGVGMDVVRTSIEKIGGTVDLESIEDQGTTIRLKIPLTLAIVPALICWTAGERYAIPQSALLELVRVDASQAAQAVERVHGAPVYRLRGTLLPLVFLDEHLKLPARNRADQDLFIVVLQADDRHFGLVVDRIRDTEEIVVKPLQKQLSGIPEFAGAAIMGDGRVALILDVIGVAERAGLIASAKSRTLVQSEGSASTTDHFGETLLVFSALCGGQMAMPLSQVARLEMLPRTSLETMGQQQVVQYRSEILPLVDVTAALARLSGKGSASGPALSGLTDEHLTDTVPVIVCNVRGRNVGLMVASIVDIVQEEAAAWIEASRPGIRHAAVIQGKVTEFIDLESLVEGVAQPLAMQQ